MELKTDGLKRREKILSMLEKSEGPISGTALSKELGVSRQVIVQDIALLRASDVNIVSTPRGYILFQRDLQLFSRRYKVKHSSSDLEKELNLIVDQGAVVVDVIIEHPIYGELSGSLNLSSRRDVQAFLQRTREQQGIPLLEMSGGIHFHTVQSDQEEVLNEISFRLKEAGFLID
ncbi:MAG: transcription repressor NadR [Lachnospiraceae bacterium]|nr:transcription repressor NadR [Lachnospiraceae bacterium]